MITESATLEQPAHDSHVAHHFDSAEQQFEAGKLGMWLFLVTEVLFFSGLFLLYAVYRSHHPEVFVDAHKYLNTTLGALNTLVLLLSSLTMAWGVRCAQLGQRRGLVFCLGATLACASFFLGVKAVEYSHKWSAGLLWAGAYSATAAADHSAPHAANANTPLIVLSIPAALCVLATAAGLAMSKLRRGSAGDQDRSAGRSILWTNLLLVSLAYFVGVGVGQGVEHFTAAHHEDIHAVHETTTVSPEALSPETDGQGPSLTGVFFSIYYAMTGVHAIHILAGMGVMTWILIRSIRGEFGPAYFGPVDYIGLYWHLVDLVWIYLFPLLYLIR